MESARQKAIEELTANLEAWQLAEAILDSGAALALGPMECKSREVAAPLARVMRDADLPTPFDDIVEASFWKAVAA